MTDTLIDGTAKVPDLPHQNLTMEFDTVPDVSLISQSIFEHCSNQPAGKVIDVNIVLVGKGRVRGSIKCGNVTLAACQIWAEEQIPKLQALQVTPSAPAADEPVAQQ